jgi:hypothetical protein
MGRAMVSLGDTRQLLVVGTQSSGTMSTATDLKELGFEVEHENSDALWSFSRDGTVSWFHGIRFLRGVADEATLNMLCIVPAPNMGFHPAMYGRAHSCSHRTKWDACWQTECKSLIKSEWGCALRKATTGDSKDSKGVVVLNVSEMMELNNKGVILYEQSRWSNAKAMFRQALQPSWNRPTVVLSRRRNVWTWFLPPCSRLNLSVATALVLLRIFHLDPTLVGHLEEQERQALRKDWYTKLATQRILTSSRKRHRAKLYGKIQKGQDIERKRERLSLSSSSSEPPLTPEQSIKLDELPETN